MPNWCDNYIIISGDTDKMKPIYDYFRNSEIVLDEAHKLRNNAVADGKSMNDVLEEYPYEENLVMNTLVPRDAEYDRIVKEHDYLLSPHSTFYGTKWDYDYRDANVGSITEDEIILNPQTAWGPCLGFCQKLSAKYGVDVVLQYEEPGNAFIGKIEYSNGQISEQHHYEDGGNGTKTYMKGLFEIDRDLFWIRVESDLEHNLFNEISETYIQYIEKRIPFLPEELVMEVESIYNQIKKDHEESN